MRLDDRLWVRHRSPGWIFPVDRLIPGIKLDGAADGIIQDIDACQATFDFQRDIPACTGARDGTCLSAAQKTATAPIFSGATDASGKVFYSSFPFDAGHNAVGWVEKGQAPTSVIAQARGAGNALGANPDVPADWSANRTRPLCPYPVSRPAHARGHGPGERR